MVTTEIRRADYSIEMATGGTAEPSYRSYTVPSESNALVSYLNSVAEITAELSSRVIVTRLLAQCNEQTGGQIVLSERFGYMPTLLDADQRPVFMHELVEALDGLVDYEELRDQFHLTHGQIHAGMMFLRRLAMTNGAGLDPDELEAESDADDLKLMAELHRGFADQEGGRVLGDH